MLLIACMRKEFTGVQRGYEQQLQCFGPAGKLLISPFLLNRQLAKREPEISGFRLYSEVGQSEVQSVETYSHDPFRKSLCGLRSLAAG